MSNINADKIYSINATITNLMVQNINGRPVSKFGNCCSCNETEDVIFCPECQSYDCCSCPNEEPDDECPDCIPYSQCSCFCHGATGATGPLGQQEQ